VPALDGGRNALSGFLFQMLGTLGAGVGELRLGTVSAPDGGDEASAVVRVVHEAFGQDAAIEYRGTAHEADIAQFKYSRAEKPISKTELNKVVNGLMLAADVAAAEGLTVRHLIIASNRPLSEPAEKSLASHQSSRSKVSKAARRLEVRRIDMNDCRTALRNFGQKYGAFDGEIEDAVRYWVGKLVDDTVGTALAVVERTDFLHALVGAAAARPLDLRRAAADARASVEAFIARHLRRLDGMANDDLVRRPAVDDLSGKVPKSGLVFVIGAGGTGKSTMVAQFATEWLDNSAGTAVPVSLQTARSVQKDWLKRLARQWVGIPDHVDTWMGDSPEKILARIALANPGASPPYVVLGLDGLDESGSDAHGRIGEVLHDAYLAHERALAEVTTPGYSIVASCRDLQETVEDFLLTSLTGERPDLDWYPSTSLRTFTDPELDEACGRLHSEIAERIRSALNRDAQASLLARDALAGVGPDAGPARVPAPTTGASLDVSALDTLRHPVLWSVFAQLPVEHQRGVLDFAPDALAVLGERLAEWSCRKAKQRNPERGWRHELVWSVTHEVATLTQSPSDAWRPMSEWLTPIVSAGTSPNDARILFDEFKSSGLIQTDATRTRWRWQYPFVCSALAGTAVPPASPGVQT
jgi:energy-coupling factor transporter ATP-binding protein EcfA2